MADRPIDAARDLLTFLDASPSPYHAAATAAARLEAAGFTRLEPVDDWSEVSAGAHVVVQGGALVAWRLRDADALDDGFRVVGAHTDSPNLRIKPRPDTGRAGYRQLGVEVYGGALLNSWLDRDLGLSGRVAVRGSTNRGGRANDPELRLLKVDRPLLRVPQLAIHLDRGVNENGLKLNAQQHLAPVWGLGRPDEDGFRTFLGDELGVGKANVLAWDVMVHDLTPAALLGRRDELLASGRLDDLLSCWAATTAIGDADDDGRGVPVICLYDHEEIGSESATGAAGSLLATMLERIAATAGRDRAGFLRALAASSCVSADGAHATHPNYAERHEPDHLIAIDGGPVLKLNANVRYATDANGAAIVRLAAEQAGVPLQEFVTRTDLPCGSTIGPVTAARLGITTVDVGAPQLSMHSARELCATGEPDRLRRLLAAYFEG
jgi:aspartyl aminopeptidase